MLTRYALIDPILRALGWDTENPDDVIPELSTPQGRPDYALRYNNEKIVMIEAKSLNTDLSRARDDGFRYCWQNRVPYFMITDGDIWELYDMREMGGKQIFRVKISDGNLGDIARKLLSLWHPAIPYFEIAPDSIIPMQTDYAGTKPSANIITLADLSKKDLRFKKLNVTLIFPDGVRIQQVNRWQHLLYEVARWALPKLENQGKLPLEKLIQGIKGKMIKPKKLNTWFIETNFSSNDCVRNSIRILNEANVNPNEVLIEGEIR